MFGHGGSLDVIRVRVVGGGGSLFGCVVYQEICQSRLDALRVIVKHCKDNHVPEHKEYHGNAVELYIAMMKQPCSRPCFFLCSHLSYVL